MTVAYPTPRPKILEAARLLPAAPQVMAGLCTLLQNENATLEQIADQIRIDPALASRVIRTSNSIMFGSSAHVSSVDEAVNRVGFREVMRMVGVAAVPGLVERSLPCYRIEVTLMRESLLLHALAAEALARFTMDLDPRTAYAAGLLRGIGIMVLDRVSRGRLPEPDVWDAERYPEYSTWESERFGMTRLDVAAMALADWKFPASFIDAIRQHLLVNDVQYGNRFACVLNLAGAVVGANDLALPGEAHCWTLNDAKLAVAGIDHDQWQMAATEAFARFERQRRALQ